MTIVLAVLLAGTESVCAPVTMAVFVIAPGWVTVAVMPKMALAPFVSVPTVHTVLLYAPLGVDDT